MKKREIRCNALRRAFVGSAGRLLSLLLLTVACTKEPVTETFTGNPVEVRFSVAMANYDADADVSRAARSMPDGERLLETVAVPLEKGWMLSADLVEEMPAATRAEYDNVVEGALFRVVAYPSAGAAVSAEYVYSGGQLGATGAALQLSDGLAYDFAFYSYNSMMTTPAAPDGSGGVPVTPYCGGNDSYDLLYGAASVASVGVGTMVNVTLSHKFTRVRIKTSVAAGGPNITGISATLKSNRTATMAAATGNLSVSGMAANQVLSAPGTAGPNTVLTGEYRIVYTNNVNPTELYVSCTAGSTTYSDMKTLYQQGLEAGKSYTLRINFKKRTRWAGSNVYWDGEQLTFAPEDTPYEAECQRYQGVFFKRGSLVGISPSGRWDADPVNGTISYVPSGTGTGWDIEHGGDYKSGISEGSDDICTYIGTLNPSLAGYYQPREGIEFPHNPQVHPFSPPAGWSLVGTSWRANTILTDDSGRYIVPCGAVHNNLAFLPASGYRYSYSDAGPAISGAGWGGYQSTYGALSFSSPPSEMMYGIKLYSAYPVRCVRPDGYQ
jgi:hypothetical protein